MLTCPECSGNLVRTRTPNGVVYGCNHCSGRMVGVAVLRKERAEREFMRDAWQRAREGSARPGRACPHCQRPMSLVDVPASGQDVALDVCTRCSCVWFDPGEYDTVPRQESVEPAKQELSAKAREAIALRHVQQIKKRGEAAAADEAPDQAWQIVPAVFGLPVECNVPAISCRPWVTWGVAAVTMAVFLATVRHLEANIEAWGFIPSLWERKGGATLVSAFFLHAGVWHVLSNLYFLLVFGDNVEDDLGRVRFAALLVFAEVAGQIAHGALDPRSTVPCVGASAGISGVIAYYAVAFPSARLALMWRFAFLFRWIRIPAWAAFAFWILIQALIAHQQMGGLGSVSALAHLGGAAVGLAMAVTLRVQRGCALRT